MNASDEIKINKKIKKFVSYRFITLLFAILVAVQYIDGAIGVPNVLEAMALAVGCLVLAALWIRRIPGYLMFASLGVANLLYGINRAMAGQYGGMTLSLL